MILSIILIVFIYEKQSSENSIINLSKRIAAEAGSAVAKIFLKKDEVNVLTSGPEDNPDFELNKKSVSEYTKGSLYKGVLKIMSVKNYRISKAAQHFQYEDFTNPQLRLLRNEYQLDKLISGLSSEFDKIVALSDWLRKIIPRGDPERISYNFNTLEILSGKKNGCTFSCSGYSIAFVQCALSLGLTARYVGLFKGHVVSEVWSNEFAKWIVMDVYNNVHYEIGGIPLNAIELHELWENRDFSNVNVLSGAERNNFTENSKEELLSFYHEFYVRMRNDWFSHKYPHWHPRANSIMNGLEWQDEFTRNNILVAKETRKKDDLYFSLNCTSINLINYDASSGALMVALETFTPNFQYFDIVAGGREFNLKKGNFIWHLSQGKNRLEVHSVNSLGVKGCKSFIEIERL